MIPISLINLNETHTISCSNIASKVVATDLPNRLTCRKESLQSIADYLHHIEHSIRQNTRFDRFDQKVSSLAETLG